jgi:hypothetical protein
VWDLLDGSHQSWNVVPSVLLVDDGSMRFEDVRPGWGGDKTVTVGRGGDGRGHDEDVRGG